jgi:hypothetical protein
MLNSRRGFCGVAFFLKLAGNDLESERFKSRYRADLSIVKKRVVIWTLVAVVMLIVVLVVVFVPGRERVSLTLLHYRRWPHGATLKLSNDTSKTITYFTDQGGGVILFLSKTESGWTNTSLSLTEVRLSALDGKLRQVYSLRSPSSPKKEGDPLEIARSRELKPGQSAEVYVELEADGLPVRAGVVCCVPRGPVAQRLGKWIGRVKQWCHLKYKEPGVIEVWCPESLQVSAKPTRTEGE